MMSGWPLMWRPGSTTVALALSWSSGVIGGSALCAGAVVVVVAAVDGVVVGVAAVSRMGGSVAPIDCFFVVDVVAGFVVDVVPGFVVDVVDFGFELDFVGAAVSFSTGRNRSSAVRPTSRCAWARSFTPGRSTTIVLPVRVICGSATPSESTRLRMMFTAVLSVSFVVLPTGASTTEIPPCRSRPRTGVLPLSNVARNVPMTTTRVPTRNQTDRRMRSGGGFRGLAHALGDRAPSDLHDHVRRDLQLGGRVGQREDRAEDPRGRHDLVADLEAGDERSVGAGLPSLGKDDEHEERRDQDDEVDEGSHHRFREDWGNAGDGSAPLVSGPRSDVSLVAASRPGRGATLPLGSASLAQASNSDDAPGSPGGGVMPRCANAAAVARRPRGVRCSRPCLSRNGS